MIRYLLPALLLTACSTSPSDPPAPCDRTREACTVEHEFGVYSIEAGGEIDGVCMSWTLDNEEPLWINAVTTENDGYFHHSNWFFVPEDEYDFEDGHWPCWENDFSEQQAALEGGVLYAQSTQTAEEEQRFLPGAAIRVPARSRIIAYTHLLNPTAEPQSTEIRVALDTLPESAVTTVLSPFRFNYGALAIPPMATSEFSGRCEMDTVYEALMGRPLELRLHYVLPHFHALGNAFRLDLVGGPRDGETIFELDSAYGEPLGHRFEEPFDVVAAGANGLAFTCGYQNDRSEEVGFGIGDQEMCVMLGFAESGFLFDGYVNETESITMDGSIARGTGPCTVVGLPYLGGQ